MLFYLYTKRLKTYNESLEKLSCSYKKTMVTKMNNSNSNSGTLLNSIYLFLLTLSPFLAFVSLLLLLDFFSFTSFFEVCHGVSSSLYEAVVSHSYFLRTEELLFDDGHTLHEQYKLPYSFDDVNVEGRRLAKLRKQVVDTFYILSKYRGNILDLPTDQTAKLFLSPESLYAAIEMRRGQADSYSVIFDWNIARDAQRMKRDMSEYHDLSDALYERMRAKYPCKTASLFKYDGFALNMDLIKKPGKADDYYTLPQFRARLVSILKQLEQRELLPPRFVRFVDFLRNEQYFAELYYIYYYLVTYYIKSNYVYTFSLPEVLQHTHGQLPCLYRHMFTVTFERLNSEAFSVLAHGRYETLFQFFYDFTEILTWASLGGASVTCAPDASLSVFPDFVAKVAQYSDFVGPQIDPESFPQRLPTAADLKPLPKVSEFFQRQGITPEMYKQLRQAQVMAELAQEANKNK